MIRGAKSRLGQDAKFSYRVDTLHIARISPQINYLRYPAGGDW